VLVACEALPKLASSVNSPAKIMTKDQPLNLQTIAMHGRLQGVGRSEFGQSSEGTVPDGASPERRLDRKKKLRDRYSGGMMDFSPFLYGPSLA